MLQMQTALSQQVSCHFSCASVDDYFSTQSLQQLLSSYWSPLFKKIHGNHLHQDYRLKQANFCNLLGLSSCQSGFIMIALCIGNPPSNGVYVTVASHFVLFCSPTTDSQKHDLFLHFSLIFKQNRHMARQLVQLTTKEHNMVYCKHAYSGSALSFVPMGNGKWGSRPSKILDHMQLIKNS